MKNELAFQTKIVEILNGMGAHAFKCSNRFKAGVLDIHYTRPLWGSAFIECKFDRRVKNDVIAVKATPKQQQFSRKERAAGGKVIGLCYVQHADDRHKFALLLFDPADPAPTVIRNFAWRVGVPTTLGWRELLLECGL